MAHQSNDNTSYKGEEKLVIAVDLGTTHTAVSYVYLYPGDIPEVKMVTRWPGQPAASGDSKIPTIVAYQNGEATSFGVEAEEFIGDSDYEIAKWFKLHLHPDHMKLSNSDQPPAYGSQSSTSGAGGMEIPPLPTRVSLAKVYTDFLRYLHTRARDFFGTSTPNGPAIWTRLATQRRLFVILAIPNGWDASQQGFLSTAAVGSGWIPATGSNQNSLLSFVTEGEASVHYALAHQSSNWIVKGMQFMVIDAGGSTVDSTLYECKEKTPKLILEEVCASECVQAGGVFVDRAASAVLQLKLQESLYGSEEFVSEMIREFEKKTKRLFDGAQTNNIIHFGRSGDNDRAVGILKGKLSMSTDEVASTYNDAIRRIVNSCQKLLRGRKVEYIILVGGFGESAFLRKQLEESFRPAGAQFVTSNEPSKKAAAEGAAIWYLRNHVVARAARFTFGISIYEQFNWANPAHLARLKEKITHVDGMDIIPGAFTPLINKDVVINETQGITRSFIRKYEQRPAGMNKFSEAIYAWSGPGCPGWIRNANGTPQPDMRIVCMVEADLSPLYNNLRKYNGAGVHKYWQVDFDICVEFGGTQLVARLQWKQGNKVCRGPATILPTSVSE